ncbi:unnamed protein product [Linum tenue]|uniref:Uncharacterized protein n=1 Tax=Linum tenue TaxID=586396 RepID=A0AAV0RKI8_9ROSI|nr:unnamed protein product [Linum tenue]
MPGRAATPMLEQQTEVAPVDKGEEAARLLADMTTDGETLCSTLERKATMEKPPWNDEGKESTGEEGDSPCHRAKFSSPELRSPTVSLHSAAGTAMAFVTTTTAAFLEEPEKEDGGSLLFPNDKLCFLSSHKQQLQRSGVSPSLAASYTIGPSPGPKWILAKGFWEPHRVGSSVAGCEKSFDGVPLAKGRQRSRPRLKQDLQSHGLILGSNMSCFSWALLYGLGLKENEDEFMGIDDGLKEEQVSDSYFVEFEKEGVESSGHGCDEAGRGSRVWASGAEGGGVDGRAAAEGRATARGEEDGNAGERSAAEAASTDEEAVTTKDGKELPRASPEREKKNEGEDDGGGTLLSPMKELEKQAHRPVGVVETARATSRGMADQVVRRERKGEARKSVAAIDEEVAPDARGESHRMSCWPEKRTKREMEEGSGDCSLLKNPGSPTLGWPYQQPLLGRVTRAAGSNGLNGVV